MSLKLDLMLRFLALALLCVLSAGAFMLFQADRDIQQSNDLSAVLIARQLAMQQTGISTGQVVGTSSADLFAVTNDFDMPGLCVQFRDQNVCKGSDRPDGDAPGWFVALDRALFDTIHKASAEVAGRGAPAGIVTLETDTATTAARTWTRIKEPIALLCGSFLALACLVYIAISRALAPVRAIIGGLERLESGDLADRLPSFRRREFDRIGSVFNGLAAHLQQVDGERRDLTRRLFSVQEEERRHLARELHDEFGQCLAGISALAASINHEAEATGSDILEEGQTIARISGTMMTMLRNSLTELRPPDIDELGLADSLSGLIVGWNSRLAGRTRFILDVDKDLGPIPSVIGVNLYRVVQEAMSNAAKHADATQVDIGLKRTRSADGGDLIELTIDDDGSAADPPPLNGTGLGLLGMRERVVALDGQLSITKRATAGLTIHASIPLQPTNSGPA